MDRCDRRECVLDIVDVEIGDRIVGNELRALGRFHQPVAFSDQVDDVAQPSGNVVRHPVAVLVIGHQAQDCISDLAITRRAGDTECSGEHGIQLRLGSGNDPRR